MRCFWLATLLFIIGCNVAPILLTPPPDINPVVGGISDTQPYFGRVALGDKGIDNSADFLLASCGCGDWRVLIAPDDGSPNMQFRVLFYSEMEYTPTARVEVFGHEEPLGLRATLDQEAGKLEGWLVLGERLDYLRADRGVNHTDSADACALCHTGEDPIYPQPVDHPPFELDPANCLDCHSVN